MVILTMSKKTKIIEELVDDIYNPIVKYGIAHNNQIKSLCEKYGFKNPNDICKINKQKILPLKHRNKTFFHTNITPRFKSKLINDNLYNKLNDNLPTGYHVVLLKTGHYKFTKPYHLITVSKSKWYKDVQKTIPFACESFISCILDNQKEIIQDFLGCDTFYQEMSGRKRSIPYQLDEFYLEAFQCEIDKSISYYVGDIKYMVYMELKIINSDDDIELEKRQLFEFMWYHYKVYENPYYKLFYIVMNKNDKQSIYIYECTFNDKKYDEFEVTRSKHYQFI